MWALEEVQNIFWDLERIAKREGYLIALYGGVLTKGFSEHDLDLIAVPYVEQPHYLINELCAYFKAQVIDTYESYLGHYAMVLQTEEGRIIDIQIRKK